MKIPTIVSLIALSLVLAGCSTEDGNKNGNKNHKNGNHNENHDHDKDKDGDKNEAPTSKPKTGMLRKIDGKQFKMFGSDVEGTPMKVADVAAKAAELDGKEVVLTGKVSSFCEAAGCWFSIKEGGTKILVQLGHDNAEMKATEDHVGKVAVAKGKLTVKEDRLILSCSGFGVSDTE